MNPLTRYLARTNQAEVRRPWWAGPPIEWTLLEWLVAIAVFALLVGWVPQTLMEWLRPN